MPLGKDAYTENANFCDNIRDPKTGKPYKFTARERLFVYHYMTNDRHVAYQAVIDAGYGTTTPGSTRQMASDILRRPHIKAAINQAFENLAMPKFEVLHRLSKIAAGSVEDLLNDDDEFDMSHARKTGSAILLKKVTIERDVIEVKTSAVDAGPDDEGEIFERSVIKERVKFEIHDPIKAMELIGKHARIFVDNVQNLNKHGEPTDERATVVIHLPDNGRGDGDGKKRKTAMETTKSKDE